MELVEAASTLGLLDLEWLRTISFFMGSINDMGVGGGLSKCVGVAEGENVRKRFMADGNDRLVVLTALRHRHPPCTSTKKVLGATHVGDIGREGVNCAHVCAEGSPCTALSVSSGMG